MRAGLLAVFVAVAIARTDPSRFLGEIDRFSIEPQIGEVNLGDAAGLHHVHQAETIDGRALLLVAGGEVHFKLGGRGKTRAFLFLRGGGQSGVDDRQRMVVAAQVEGEASLAVRAGGVVVERPRVAGAVVLQRRGAVFSRQIRGDESAARLIAAGDEPHREPPAFVLEIEVEPERTDGPPAAAGLLRIHKAEEDAATASRGFDGESARGRESVVEGFRRNLRRIHRRSCAALHAPADLAWRRAGKARGAVAEVLFHDRHLGELDAVVVAFPAGVAVEVLRLERRLRGSRGGQQGKGGGEELWAEVGVHGRCWSQRWPSGVLSGRGPGADARA